MNYEKPELVSRSAIEAIQESGPMNKTFDPTTDGSRPTDPAYQADE
jgi:hypothetical protein